MTEPINQPEALRLASILQYRLPSIECLEKAAAELRQLHAANEALGKRQEWWNESLFRVQQVLDKALAERDDLQVALRTSQSAACKIIERLQAERDEARAELARLTTLRPIASLPPNTQCLRWTQSRTGQHWMLVDKHDWHDFWTPLPPVKEADK